MDTAQNFKVSESANVPDFKKGGIFERKRGLLICLIMVALILMYFLRNSWLGFFINLLCIFSSGNLSASILSDRYMKKQPVNIWFMILSILFLLTALAFVVLFFENQVYTYYQINES